MALTSKPTPSATKSFDSPARWEARTTSRVLEVGREQILERSRQLVDAAYELLKTEGLEGLTIRAVLEKTSLSRRAFYERFTGKDDLVLAVFEHAIRLGARRFNERFATLTDPIERLQLIVSDLVLANSSSDSKQSDHLSSAMSREHLRLAESRPEDLQAALEPLITLLAQQLSAGMAAGSVRDADPNRLATLFYNLLSTTVHAELLTHEDAQLDPTYRTKLAADIWEFCRRAIAA